MELTPVELERLSAVIARRSGLLFPEARWPFLRDRARAVMARGGFTSGRRWTSALERAAEEGAPLYAELEAALQVHETSFFRYERHHDALRDVVLPALGAGAGSGREERLRIWSAGCSTGQEPYSIAMTLSEALPPNFPVEIVAIDGSEQALKTAAAGVYTAADVRSVPATLLARYFRRRNDRWTAVSDLKEMIKFLHYDVRHGFYIGKFDIVFCCNVLLYFTPAVKRQVMERLTNALVPGGFLFLGHADGVTPSTQHFDRRRAAHGFVYHRRAAVASRASGDE
ncbi:MAG TPA: CheR family methyltransferase [Methylomirabilota bacterium]|jgi:chemotaxis protein methyltransferase CheR